MPNSSDVPVSLTPNLADHFKIELTAPFRELLTGGACMEVVGSASESSLAEKSNGNNSDSCSEPGTVAVCSVCCKRENSKFKFLCN